MPLSVFNMSFKAASMLDARRALHDIRVASYPHTSDRERSKFHRELAASSTQYLKQRVKSFKEVVGNIARRMIANG